MKTALGIDTGGTYTDGVIIDINTKKIIKKAKARTTREDLSVGIEECLNNLDSTGLSRVGVVAISTTLATNAVVEGRGGEVGAIIIGPEPVAELPVSISFAVNGGHDVAGKEIQELDEAAVMKAVEDLKGRVAAVVISSYFSVRNPEHELRAKQIVTRYMKEPVVCAHELTTSLGFRERTVTAALNARLLPVIAELIESVKKVLHKKGIDAPVLIVKSDGSLASIEVVREKPIETILSGPAASIIGGLNLSGRKDAVILDMGGTTTDIALVKDLEPSVDPEGAVIGGWRTRVKAAEVCTYGIGGDSRIQIERGNRIRVGPQRVYPLCYAARQWPCLIDELQEARLDQNTTFILNQKSDCLMMLRGVQDDRDLSPAKRDLLKLLQERPHSLYYLANKLGINPDFLPYQDLVDIGAIGHISITPTDILHAAGELNIWSTEAALLGVGLLAAQYDLGFNELISMAMEETVNNLIVAIMQSLIHYERRVYEIENNRHNVFWEKLLNNQADGLFSCSIAITHPIIAIGAPVKAWLPKVKQKITAELIIPEDAGVANAYGAATGRIFERTEVLIRPYGSGFGVYLPWEFTVFDDLDQAVRYATESTLAWIKNKAVKAGAEAPEIKVDSQNTYAGAYGFQCLLETRLVFTATGKPRLAEGTKV